MTEYKISERAYAKIIFHAAKYPHLAVNGILLAEKTQKGSVCQIVDAIPLFHQCLYVTPMAEIALLQIDAYAEQENLIISGYYAAAENFYDNTIDKAPGAKIADKILEHNKSACFVVVDNKLVSMAHEHPALKVYTNSSGEAGRWSKANYMLYQSETTLSAVSALLRRGVMRDVVDFDNHLDNPENDWTNEFINVGLKQLLTMY